MTAYSEKELYNFNILAQAREAFKASKISEESLHKIEQAHPCKLYTPNFFIALAFGLLTIIAFSFTGFLFGLLTNVDTSSGYTFLFIFMTALSYFCLEWLVKSKLYFNAGIDNILMILVLVFIAGIFLSSVENPSWIFINGVLMIVAFWFSVRFADSFMAIVSCSFFFVICFLLFLESGITALVYFSFLMMILIGCMFFLIKKMAKNVIFIYEKIVTVLTVFLLIAFYAAGNYWLISELNWFMFNQAFILSSGWILWIFTFIIPVMYIVYGVAKNNLLYIRTGIILVMMTLLTYKYFYTLFPLEVEMLLLGLVLIAICYFLIKWLRPARHGFTSEIISPRPAWKNVEALVIAETMSGDKTLQEDTLMSGGSGGGGGASGDF